jgi:pyridoxine 5-phosphate synthase
VRGDLGRRRPIPKCRTAFRKAALRGLRYTDVDVLGSNDSALASALASTGFHGKHSLLLHPRLSVNLNKNALLRNSRRTGVPEVTRFAALAYKAGADGVTVHPRPDERHIRRADVFELAQQMRPWRPQFELNIEGYPDDRFFDIVRVVRPEQCTLVPDGPDVFTSEQGWKLGTVELPSIKRAVSTAKQCGSRVILFVDPDPTVVSSIRETDADGIEIYTGSYASAARGGDCHALLNDIAEAARRAAALGLATRESSQIARSA